MPENQVVDTINSKNDVWFQEFLILVIFTASISGVAYLYQNRYFEENFVENEIILYNVLRALRMTIFYVIFPLLFLKRHNRNWRELGIVPKREIIVESLIGGILIYSVAMYVFVTNQIFFAGWQVLSTNEIVIKLILVAIMASITDLWTRGFILFQVANRFSDSTAIIAQNITWFVIHIYEIELLEPYIGLTNGILLTLFLGIGGDIVALRTRNVFGLMIGHILLNVVIFAAANSYI